MSENEEKVLGGKNSSDTQQQLEELLDEVVSGTNPQEGDKAQEADLFDDDGYQEESDDQASEAPQKKKKRTGLIIGLVALALAAGAGGYYYFAYLPQQQAKAAAAVQAAQEESFAMPSLTLETADVAEKMLADAGLDCDVMFISSEEIPEGLVAVQSVSEGVLVQKGDKITLYISLGPAPTPTPEPEPLPTPTPKPTPKPVRTAPPVIELPVETPCPTG